MARLWWCAAVLALLGAAGWYSRWFDAVRATLRPSHDAVTPHAHWEDAVREEGEESWYERYEGRLALPIVAMDFGAAESRVAIWKDGAVEVIKNGDLDYWPTSPGADAYGTDPRADFDAVAGICGALWDAAEAALGSEVGELVLTYPDYLYRRDGMFKMKSACLSLRRRVYIEREAARSTAAAIAYGLLDGIPGRDPDEEAYFVVVDTDGGLTATVVLVEDGIFDRLGCAHSPHYHSGELRYLFQQAIDGSVTTEYQSHQVVAGDIDRVVFIGPGASDDDALRAEAEQFFGREMGSAGFVDPPPHLAPLHGAATHIKWLRAEPEILGRTCPCGGHGTSGDSGDSGQNNGRAISHDTGAEEVGRHDEL